MAQKKYRLSALANPFLRGGNFSFRVSYTRDAGGGVTQRVSQKNAPVVTIPNNGVVVTNNETAQACLEQFIVPQKTQRNGQRWPAGNMFNDITSQTGVPADVDLDTILT
jgi:hypothetical protein